MSLETGTKLSRYEIRSKLGEGGMGVVYRARDEKLNRDIAIKVLPAAFADDVQRLHRFEQEAQAAGALNHPTSRTSMTPVKRMACISSQLEFIYGLWRSDSQLDYNPLSHSLCSFVFFDRKLIAKDTRRGGPYVRNQVPNLICRRSRR